MLATVPKLTEFDRLAFASAMVAQPNTDSGLAFLAEHASLLTPERAQAILELTVWGARNHAGWKQVLDHQPIVLEALFAVCNSEDPAAAVEATRRKMEEGISQRDHATLVKIFPCNIQLHERITNPHWPRWSNPDLDTTGRHTRSSGQGYVGYDDSFEMLPHLSLTWYELARDFELTKKPVADFGACFSTFAAEGYIRGIPVVPVDIRQPYREGWYLGSVHESLLQLGDDYSGRFKWFDSARMQMKQPIPDFSAKTWGAALAATRAFMVSDLAAIPVADRAFSHAIAHDSVPKHSGTVDYFCDRHLPEMLRVTDRSLRVFPFATYETTVEWGPRGRTEDLHVKDAMYADDATIARVRRIADVHGFDFRLEIPKDQEPMKRFRFPLTAIFTRNAG